MRIVDLVIAPRIYLILLDLRCPWVRREFLLKPVQNQVGKPYRHFISFSITLTSKIVVRDQYKSAIFISRIKNGNLIYHTS